MDQGVIYNLKTHYWNLVLKLQLQALDKGQDVVSSVLDALRSLRRA